MLTVTNYVEQQGLRHFILIIFAGSLFHNKLICKKDSCLFQVKQLINVTLLVN